MIYIFITESYDHLFITQVIDIVLHCLDHGHLKSRSISEVFPALSRFSQISHCTSSRRLAVGSRNGSLALHELRGQKCQVNNHFWLFLPNLLYHHEFIFQFQSACFIFVFF